jgi:hypothetical protein
MAAEKTPATSASMVVVKAAESTTLCSEGQIEKQSSVGCMCRRAAQAMRSCQHMLAMRDAPEVGLRRSPLLDLVVQLSLLISVFRGEALRAHM